ncbi:TPA: hypothetical protein SL417_005018, partial [Pseudomonas aeruginosa]|nr:hypothetical protein [Pseudomonas aeruginosa]
AALAGLALALRYRSAWPPLLGMGLAVALQPLFGLLGLPALLSRERWRRRASLVRCRIHHQEPR